MKHLRYEYPPRGGTGGTRWENARRTHAIKVLKVFSLLPFLKCISVLCCGLKLLPNPGAERRPGLWNKGIWHFNPNRSFQSLEDPKLLYLMLKITMVILLQKTFKLLMFCIWEIFLGIFWEISFDMFKLFNIWTRKTFFFLNKSKFRQKFIGTIIRGLIGTLIAIVRHWIKTHPYLRSVTSKPTVGGGRHWTLLSG